MLICKDASSLVAWQTWDFYSPKLLYYEGISKRITKSQEANSMANYRLATFCNRRGDKSYQNRKLCTHAKLADWHSWQEVVETDPSLSYSGWAKQKSFLLQTVIRFYGGRMKVRYLLGERGWKRSQTNMVCKDEGRGNKNLWVSVGERLETVCM